MNNIKQTYAHASFKKFLILPLVGLLFITVSCNSNIHRKVMTNSEASGKGLAQMRMADFTGIQNTMQPFVVVQQMPQFPGGVKDMMKFIKAHISYPEIAIKDNVQGTVILDFVVNQKGHITDMKILRSPGQSLSNEAMKIIHSMPTWIPGKENGKPVSVAYALPISFELSNTKSS